MSEKLRNPGVRAVLGLTNLAIKGLTAVGKAGLNVALNANDERIRRSALHEIQIIMFGRDIVEGETTPPVLPGACPPGSPELALFKERCNWLTRHNGLA